jgi:hypothetical protein
MLQMSSYTCTYFVGMLRKSCAFLWSHMGIDVAAVARQTVGLANELQCSIALSFS